MSFESIITITIAIVSAVAAPVLYLWRSVVSRLDQLEKNQQAFIKEEEVRRMLDDKFIPLQQDCTEIKASIHQLLTHILEMKK